MNKSLLILATGMLAYLSLVGLNAVPEPGALVLISLGFIGLMIMRRRQKA